MTTSRQSSYLSLNGCWYFVASFGDALENIIAEAHRLEAAGLLFLSVLFGHQTARVRFFGVRDEPVRLLIIESKRPLLLLLTLWLHFCQALGKRQNSEL